VTAAGEVNMPPMISGIAGGLAAAGAFGAVGRVQILVRPAPA
jgi:hypothetical protein